MDIKKIVSEMTLEVKRPVRELRAYEKIPLAAWEERTVEFEIDERWFAYYSPESERWCTSAGDYTVYYGTMTVDRKKEINV